MPILLTETILVRLEETKITKIANNRRRVEGVKAQHCNLKNKNNRRYPLETTWGPHLEEGTEFMKRIGSRQVFGHTEHPKDGRADLNLAAFIVEKAYPDGDIVKLDFETTSNPPGRALASLIDDMLNFGLSSRATGSLKKAEDGVDEVQDDFEPETWDAVADPSTPGARMVQERLEEAYRQVLQEGTKCVGRGTCKSTGMCMCKEAPAQETPKENESKTQEGVITVLAKGDALRFNNPNGTEETGTVASREPYKGAVTVTPDDTGVNVIVPLADILTVNGKKVEPRAIRGYGEAVDDTAVAEVNSTPTSEEAAVQTTVDADSPLEERVPERNTLMAFPSELEFIEDDFPVDTMDNNVLWDLNIGVVWIDFEEKEFAQAIQFAVNQKRSYTKTRIQYIPTKRVYRLIIDGGSRWQESTESGEGERVEEELQLGKGDHRVIEAFTDKIAMDSKKLTTDGERLDGNWMGGNRIAWWEDGKIHIGDLGGRAAQTVARVIRRIAPKNWMAEAVSDEAALSEKEPMKKKGSAVEVLKGGKPKKAAEQDWKQIAQDSYAEMGSIDTQIRTVADAMHGPMADKMGIAFRMRPDLHAAYKKHKKEGMRAFNKIAAEERGNEPWSVFYGNMHALQVENLEKAKKEAAALHENFSRDSDRWFDEIADEAPEVRDAATLMLIATAPPTERNFDKLESELTGMTFNGVTELRDFIEKIQNGQYSGEFRNMYGRTSQVSELFSLLRQALSYNEAVEVTNRPLRGRAVEGFESDESVAAELKMVIDNDGQLYRQQFIPIVKNLMTKWAKGQYDSERSIKLWMYLMDSGAKKYAKESGGQWNDMFPKNIRIMAAKMFRDEFEVEARLGNYTSDTFLPKKYAGFVPESATPASSTSATVDADSPKGQEEEWKMEAATEKLINGFRERIKTLEDQLQDADKENSILREMNDAMDDLKRREELEAKQQALLKEFPELEKGLHILDRATTLGELERLAEELRHFLKGEKGKKDEEEKNKKLETEKKPDTVKPSTSRVGSGARGLTETTGNQLSRLAEHNRRKHLRKTSSDKE